MGENRSLRNSGEAPDNAVMNELNKEKRPNPVPGVGRVDALGA
jgi:hypothetical protein